MKAKVTSTTLNVRQAPNANAPILGKLLFRSIIDIESFVDGWAKLKYRNNTAYVSATYIKTIDEGDGAFFHQRQRFLTVPMEPVNKLPEPTDVFSKLPVKIWNSYGNLLKALSNDLGIEPSCAVAVFCKESGGTGIWQTGKSLIRFENHVFYDRWGKLTPENQALFTKHFKGTENWKGHAFRPNEQTEWITFHGKQELEWQVLEFAMKLNEEGALKSISMGAPQIMGAYHQAIGYNTVNDMFQKFNYEMRFQIFGFFDFLTPQMIESLRTLDFVTFARFYNGSGQEQIYGADMLKFYKALPKL